MLMLHCSGSPYLLVLLLAYSSYVYGDLVDRVYPNIENDWAALAVGTIFVLLYVPFILLVVGFIYLPVFLLVRT
jgi:hypothetical protein